MTVGDVEGCWGRCCLSGEVPGYWWSGWRVDEWSGEVRARARASLVTHQELVRMTIDLLLMGPFCGVTFAPSTSYCPDLSAHLRTLWKREREVLGRT